MEAFHARYPFLSASRDAAQNTTVDMVDIVTDNENLIIHRAVDRIQSAIESGTVGSPHRIHRVELLSYPLARVIVSLINEPGLTRRYAEAEAHTAHQRFLTDIDHSPDLQSVKSTKLTQQDLLREFDLENDVRSSNDHYLIDATAYLRLASSLSDDSWRLVNRTLDEGNIQITEHELFILLREAVRQRVEADLPMSVPDPISDSLSSIVKDIRSLVADIDLPEELGKNAPNLYPPCIKALLTAVDESDPIEPHSQFTLVTFLSSIGMHSDDIIDRLSSNPSFDKTKLAYQLAHLRETPTSPPENPPPSCETMVAYDDCVNKDSLCETIAHPLNYYDSRLTTNPSTDFGA